MQQPISNGHITQSFHTNHRGLDIGWILASGASYIGTPYLLAIDDGVIVKSGFFNTGGGNVVVLEIPSLNPNFKYIARYVHNASNLVKKGDRVKKGQRLAIGGKTGNATGPHVHFELWIVPSNYVYRGINNTDRNKYAIPPQDVIPFNTIDTRNRITVFNIKETPIDKIAKPKSNILNMRDYPSTSAVVVGTMIDELVAVAKTNKIQGYEWIKCEYKGGHVYVASNWVTLSDRKCEPEIIEVIKIVEVEKPFKETFVKDGLTVTVEKVVGK